MAHPPKQPERSSTAVSARRRFYLGIDIPPPSDGGVFGTKDGRPRAGGGLSRRAGLSISRAIGRLRHCVSLAVETGYFRAEHCGGRRFGGRQFADHDADEAARQRRAAACGGGVSL